MFSFCKRCSELPDDASFISTARKQGIDAFVALTSAFNGKAEKFIFGVGSELLPFGMEL